MGFRLQIQIGGRVGEVLAYHSNPHLIRQEALQHTFESNMSHAMRSFLPALIPAASTPCADGFTKQHANWNGIEGLCSFARESVRFRFSLGKGSLYSFWVTSDAKGASNGFVGAGGPEFNGVRDVSPAY